MIGQLHRGRHRGGPAARRGRRARRRHATAIVVADPANPSEGCELVIVPRRRRHDPARRRAGPRTPACRCSASTSATSGFLAEAEREDLGTVGASGVVARDYDVEERMTLDVRRRASAEPRSHRSWALNEATVEKAARERMLEVVVEVDGRPLSTFGCDGVVMATPTGSTAYAFSAGGPVVWPEVEALLLVPISRARAVRPAAGGRPALAARGRGAAGHRGHRRAVVRRAAHGRAAARRADRGAPQRDRRCGWPG